MYFTFWYMEAWNIFRVVKCVFFCCYRKDAASAAPQRRSPALLELSNNGLMFNNSQY